MDPTTVFHGTGRRGSDSHDVARSMVGEQRELGDRFSEEFLANERPEHHVASMP